METWRYVGASLALGAVAVWGSEALFWSAAPAGLTAPDLVLTCGAYALACACALSAVAWSGCGGLAGLFLAGALVGWLVEGVLAGTMYAFLPFQLVWTPLAWHALITAVGVLGIGRASARWGFLAQASAMVGLGAFGGVWAAFWPLERTDLPGGWPGAWGVLAYLGGTALVLPFAQVALDRVGRVPRPPTRVLCVAPAFMLALWVAGWAVQPAPARLALPLLLAATLWAMRRLGGQGRAVSLGAPPERAWRHVLVLLAPCVAASVAGLAWRGGGWEVNWAVALGTSAVGAGWWTVLLWRAWRLRADG